MKTNLGLVEHAKKALSEQWGYVYGTYGLILTESLLEYKLKQYPKETVKYESFIRSNWLNKRTADCVGLIKSYLWWDGEKPVYDKQTDLSANSASAEADEFGPISTIPEIPGICVWKNGHVGIYIGDWQVIESKGTMFGVVQTPLTGAGANAWTHWFEYPGISYVSDVTAKAILKALSAAGELDNQGVWEKAIDTIKAVPGNLGDIDILKFTDHLIEKVYNYAKSKKD